MKSPLPAHAFFGYEDIFQQVTRIGKFFDSFISAGGKCYYITSDNSPYHALKLFENCGTDVLKHTCSGELEILSAQDTYLAKGYFEPSAALGAFIGIGRESMKHGFNRLCFAVDISWALGKMPELQRLMEYEKMINPGIRDLPVVALCMYNKNFFGPEVINELLRVHPHRFCDEGQIKENPDFVPAGGFVKGMLGKIKGIKDFFGK